MSFEDIEKEFLGEEIPDKKKPVRRKQSKKKGNRGELECVHILQERFKGETFSRTMGSGAYTGGKNAKNAETLTEEQKLMFASDIRTPVGFKFSIEHKFYEKLDFYDLFNASSSLFKWYEQSETDAKLLDRSPMLIVKTNNHKRIVFVKLDSAPATSIIKPVFIHSGRCCYWLEDFLNALPNSYFFKSIDKK